MKPRIYKKKKSFSAVLDGILRVIVVLLILGIIAFFVLRGWTVYDEDGAHIQFPWVQTAESNRSPAKRVRFE